MISFDLKRLRDFGKKFVLPEKINRFTAPGVKRMESEKLLHGRLVK